MATHSLVLMAALLLTGPTERPAPATAELQMSQVFLIHDVPAAAQETGLLMSVQVQPGDEVKEGQILAKLDDRQAQVARRAAEREREAAMARAEDDIDVQYAMKSFQLAEAEWNDSLRINQRSEGTVANSEVRRLELAKHRAELQIAKSRLDMRVARLTAEVHQAAVDSADEKIARCEITAPFDGVVMDVQKQAREWVTAGDPVIRVVRMDRLRVDGLVKADELDPHELEGRRVTVIVGLARGRTAKLDGKIVFVNQVVQAGNRFRVRAEVQNRREPNGQWLLNPGKSARTIVHIRD